MLHLPRNMHGRAASTRWWQAGALLLLTLGAALAADLAEPHHVTAVRFWSLGGVTRIAVETDGDFQVKSDRLDSPDRLFFDLMGTRPTLGSKGMTTIPVSDHFVRQIRVAEPQHNVTRVVLDLEPSVESSISRLDNPSRLIIELRASGSAPETTKVPVKAPPSLIERTPPEPTPASKPAERRPFTPPSARPAAIPVVQAQEVVLEPPPELQFRNNAPRVPALLAANYKPGPAPARATNLAVLAKPVPATLANVASTTPPQPVETALPAKRNSTGDRSMIRALGLKVGRIVLDPGHGGHDTGSVGPEGLREKDLVLDVSQRLGRLIETRMGSEVIFTRSDDTFVPLERRTEIANEAKADLFLSIHANSSPLRSAAGVETYYLNFTTSRSALDLASRENSGSQMTVYELQDLLEKIALKDKVEESREFATRVQTALFTLSAKATDSRSKDRGIKRAPFVVLIGASMPSVLAEIGFVSNAHDESVMRREEYRERTAEALYKGISSYANSLSHFQVAQRH
ncbi:MAG TPA: N-acetylmuramoyl-L-alanine amidase [Bryobacteraceae bacterium]|nr:N-acetylmuramoyl-L-alanine amidase [Bryobacteraceae bacterium]